ncbi:DUF5959 family protein [Streptomyces sp. 21So2-11]|uniref:DUF5959 family protein n=1 Tax=Streptomyces sp. 21So2-11 TaxID=3144408 RepID=UPI003219E434
MVDVAPMDLVLLEDGEGNSVSISVLGEYPKSHDESELPPMLRALIVLETPFVGGREELPLWNSRLEEWARALDRLEAGEDAGWMTMGSGLSLFIRLTGERDCPEVVLEEVNRSMVTVRVPIALPDGWIADHRQRLRTLMDAWNPDGLAPRRTD